MHALIRRSAAVGALVALASVGLLVQPAAALHEGAVADCGDAGTFELRFQLTEAGFGAPPVNSVLQFEGGGTLSILREYRNGVLDWEPSDGVGIAHSNVEEVTCSFTLRNGDELVITGVFTG